MIAVLGAGLLGSGMVERMLARGEAVRVWNRTAAKLAPLVERGAVATASAAEAVTGATRVHLVLSEDDAVDSVIAAARPGLGADVVVFDHSTNRPDRVAARYVALRAAGIRYVPAPVFMAPRDARDGTGLMLVAGEDAEHPALAAMTGKVWHVGARPDLAAVYKLLGNSLIVQLAGVMGDTFALGAAQGLGPEAVMALFDHFRPAPNGIAPRVALRGTQPPSFELTMARKDVRLMIEAAGGPEGLVVLPAVAATMDAAIAAGQGDRDFAIYAWPRATRGS